jgi:hypothetical protein
MLRWLVLALLLANALFLAWSQGWLSPWLVAGPGAAREPWRLQQQLRPEMVRVLPPGSAPPAAASAPTVSASAASAAAASVPAETATGTALACFESAPLAAADLDAAEQALALVLPARGWIRASRDTPPQQVVAIGPLAREALARKREELKRLGVAFEPGRLPGDEGGAALLLGRYDSAPAAQAALDAFAQRGVRTARVLALREPGRETRLRIENVTPAQAGALRGLGSPALGAAGLVPCSPPPVAGGAR